MKKWKVFIIGLVMGALLSATSMVFAGNIMQTISVLLNKVNVAIDDELVGRQGDNYILDNGEEVPLSISYKETTYLPIRKVAEVLGSQVKWEQATKTIHIMGKETAKEEDKPIEDSQGQTEKPKDIVKPEIVDISHKESNSLEITFSEEIDQETAEDINNYKLAYKHLEYLTIKYNDENKLVIKEVILDASKKKVVIITEKAYLFYIALEVKGIKDVSGNVMETYSEGFKIIDPDKLDIDWISTSVIEFTFDVPVDEAIATNKANYRIHSPRLHVNKLGIKHIVYDAELKKVTITTDGRIFSVYELELLNIKDIYGEPVYPTQGSFGEMPSI